MSTTLEGWKQIAYYLRVSATTAQKWEYRHRMPVHHDAAGRVFVQSGELETWKLERQVAELKAQLEKLPPDRQEQLKRELEAGVLSFSQ